MSYESCKPLGPWVIDLVDRIEFFSTWIDLVTNTGEKILKMALATNVAVAPSGVIPNTWLATELDELLTKIEPSSYWLPAFFFPQGMCMLAYLLA